MICLSFNPGRRKINEDEEARDIRIHEIIDHVKERGLFKTRKPEGNIKEH